MYYELSLFQLEDEWSENHQEQPQASASVLPVEDPSLSNAKRLHEKSKKLALKFFTTLQKEQINEQSDDGE